MASDALGIKPSQTPRELDPDSALIFLRAFATATSRLLVFPIQDLLASSPAHRENRPEDERINVPGTSGGTNWLYRVKPELELLIDDAGFAARMETIVR
jgi:4-alpha-glucanotransferase